MPRRTSLLLLSCAVAAAACTSTEDRSSDTTAAAAQTTTPSTAASTAPAGTETAPASLSLAQLGGTWKGRTMPTDRDSVIANWTLSAPADTSQWAVTFQPGPKAPLHVKALGGDSVVFSMGPYQSIRAKQLVTADVVMRLRGDSLVGTYIMHSAADAAKSLGQGRVVAARTKA